MATEKRLIDAIALISKARRMETTDNNGIPVDTYAVPVLAIEDAPTVDAVEVVHGEWTIIEDDYTGLVGLECSECEITWWFEEEYSFDKYHYCPGCGAKINAKEEKQLLFADMEEIIDATD